MERIVKRYYDELENGRIMGRRCQACGAVEFPPVIACNACGHFDMDWIEMSGNALCLDFIKTGAITNPRVQQFQPCVLAFVRVEEGPEISAVVCGITDENIAEYRARLPFMVKARIVQRDGFKSVVYDVLP